MARPLIWQPAEILKLDGGRDVARCWKCRAWVGDWMRADSVYLDGWERQDGQPMTLADGRSVRLWSRKKHKRSSKQFSTKVVVKDEDMIAEIDLAKWPPPLHPNEHEMLQAADTWATLPVLVECGRQTCGHWSLVDQMVKKP